MTALKNRLRLTENVRAATTVMLLATGWFVFVMFMVYELLKAFELIHG